MGPVRTGLDRLHGGCIAVGFRQAQAPQAKWNKVISGGAFSRTGVKVVPIPRLT